MALTVFNTNDYYSGQGKLYAGSVDPDIADALPENIHALGNVIDIRLETEETYHEPTLSIDGVLYPAPPVLLSSSVRMIARLESISAANLAWLLHKTLTTVTEAAGARTVLAYHGKMSQLPRSAISGVTLGGTALTPFTVGGTPWHYRHDPLTGALVFNDGSREAIPAFPANARAIDVVLMPVNDAVCRFSTTLAVTETLAPGQRVALYQTGMHLVCDIVGWGEDFVDVRYPSSAIPADANFTAQLDAFEVSVTTSAASTVERVKDIGPDKPLVFFRFVGINTADNTPRVVDIHRVRIAPSSGLDLIPADISNIEIEGTVLPYERSGQKPSYYEERRLKDTPTYTPAV